MKIDTFALLLLKKGQVRNLMEDIKMAGKDIVPETLEEYMQQEYPPSEWNYHKEFVEMKKSNLVPCECCNDKICGNDISFLCLGEVIGFSYESDARVLFIEKRDGKRKKYSYTIDKEDLEKLQIAIIESSHDFGSSKYIKIVSRCNLPMGEKYVLMIWSSHGMSDIKETYEDLKSEQKERREMQVAGTSEDY